nr:hypothetical protein [Protofrankia coriariae]
MVDRRRKWLVREAGRRVADRVIDPQDQVAAFEPAGFECLCGGLGEVDGELVRRLMSRLDVVFQRPHDDIRQRLVHARERPDPRAFGQPAGEQPVQDQPEGIQIRTRAERGEVALFRRHPERRPGPTESGGVFQQLRDPEIDNLEGAVVREQQVRRFDVTVQHVLAVHIRQRVRGRQPDPAHRLRRKRTVDLVQGLAGNKLHEQQEEAVDVKGVENVDQVRMVELCQDLRFIAGAPMPVRALQRHRLDRDEAVQSAVQHFEHVTEPATAKPVVQFVTVG